MEILENPTVKDEIMHRIRDKYGFNLEGTNRTGIHLSDLIYCVTKSYYRRALPGTKPTDREALLWAVGLGLEEVLLEAKADDNRPGFREIDGVKISPDYQLIIEASLAELKTTRAYYNKEGNPSKGWPMGWIKQMAGYSYAYRQRSYMLAVYQIIQASLIGKEFKFTEEELDEFWEHYILPRKRALEKSIETGLPPEPFKYNESWECNNCAMQMICGSLSSVGHGYEPRTEDYHIPESMIPPEPPPKQVKDL